MADESKQDLGVTGKQATDQFGADPADGGMVFDGMSGEVSHGKQGSAEAEAGDEKKEEKAAAEPEGKSEEGKGSEEEEKEDTKEEEAQAAPLEDLGDYTPETSAKFEQRYVVQEGDAAGTLNMEVLSNEFAANLDKAEGDTAKAGLNEGTYKFLEEQLGYSRDFVKQVEAGQVALRQQALGAVHERAGGKAQWDAALKWAGDGGYTEAENSRFLGIVNGSDVEAKADAVDALMARYAKTTSGSPNSGQRLGRRKRPVSPERHVAKSAGGGGGPTVEPYETAAEFQADVNKAVARGDQKAIDAADRRAKASPWFTGGKK